MAEEEKKKGFLQKIKEEPKPVHRFIDEVMKKAIDKASDIVAGEVAKELISSGVIRKAVAEILPKLVERPEEEEEEK